MPITNKKRRRVSLSKNPTRQKLWPQPPARKTKRSRHDRHRGGGHPPTPATPPCVRVRTRRFELVTLASIDQRWKAERFEVSIRKPHREGFGPGQIPGAKSAAGRVAGQSRANPQF